MQSHAKHSRNDSVCYLVPDRKKNMFFSLTTVKSKFRSSLLSLATSTKQYNLFYSRMLMYFSTMFPAFISVHYMCSFHKHFILKTPSGLVSHWWRGPYKRWVGGSDTSLRHFHPHICLQCLVWERERTTTLFFCFFIWFDFWNKRKPRNDAGRISAEWRTKVPTYTDSIQRQAEWVLQPDGGLLAPLMPGTLCL